MTYYEMSKAVADHYYNGVRYWAADPQLRLLQHSTRVWQEKDDTVKYIKHRDTGIMTPVDMREFFLVKLRAKSI